MKFKAMKYIRGADTHNRYDYISECQHNNIFLQLEQNNHDIVTNNSEHSQITVSRSDITNE